LLKPKPESGAKQLTMGIITNNDQTAAELHRYFQEVGTRTTRLPNLHHMREHQDEIKGLAAVLLFPDDFKPQIVSEILIWLSMHNPTLLQLIVTRQTQYYTQSPTEKVVPKYRFVMPKPTFVWLILDAIRAHQSN
jgi:hypothetical protein